MNLFIAHHEAIAGGEANRFGSGWENLFTEQLAFFLRADALAANAVASLVLGRPGARVADIATQFEASDGRPDIRLTLADGRAVLVEHKFDANLGQTQLERYLKDGRVALITDRTQRIPKAVLDAPGYLRPHGRDYFHWSDVYQAISSAAVAPEGLGALREHFRGYMRELGFAPSSLSLDWRRLFEDRTIPENQKVQKAFGRLLGPLDRFGEKRGLKVTRVSHKGRSLKAKRTTAWRHIVVAPERVRVDYMHAPHAQEFDPGYEGLTVRAVFDAAQVERAKALYAAFGEGFVDRDGRQWRPVKPRPVNQTRWTVALTTPLAPILERQATEGSTVGDAAVQGAGELLMVLKKSLRAG